MAIFVKMPSGKVDNTFAVYSINIGKFTGNKKDVLDVPHALVIPFCVEVLGQVFGGGNYDIIHAEKGVIQISHDSKHAEGPIGKFICKVEWCAAILLVSASTISLWLGERFQLFSKLGDWLNGGF